MFSIFACFRLWTKVAPRCPNFWNKWSRGFRVIPIWCITYNVNKLTHITNLVMLGLQSWRNNSILSIFACFRLWTKVAPRCPNFWRKWSWGFFLIPIWWTTYIVRKLTHITYLVMYLVTIVMKKLKFVGFCLFQKGEPRCPDFSNKWSWGLCLIARWWITYNKNKLNYKLYLVMYLVKIVKQ